MTHERRKGEEPVPADLENHLTEAQQLELSTLGQFGWHIKFIRRPLFQDKVVVVFNEAGNSIGILEPDGRLNLDPNIELRE